MWYYNTQSAILQKYFTKPQYYNQRQRQNKKKNKKKKEHRSELLIKFPNLDVRDNNVCMGNMLLLYILFDP